MRKLLVSATILLCVGTVHAEKGTHRVSRMISDSRPWFDCLSEDYAVAGNVVTCDDDSNDDAPPIQACIDEASAVNGVAYLGECAIKVDTSLELNDPVTLMGCGGNSAWVGNSAAGREACTTITMDDSMATPVIYVRGDPVSGRGFVPGRGDYGAQGINIIGFKILSETDYGGDVGIMLDGTYWDAVACDEPGGCPAGCTPEPAGSDCDCVTAGAAVSPDVNCRGLVRDVLIQDVGCIYTGSHCFYQRGNVFDITYRDVFAQRPGNTALFTEDLADDTCENESCRSGQITVHDAMLFSCTRTDGNCDNAAWAVDTHYTYYDGGHIQGDFGARLGQNSTVIGTHIEEDGGSAGNIGVQLTGRNVTVITDQITGWDNCLVIGEDGSAGMVDGFFINVGLIGSCSAVGLTIEDGGRRRGVLNVGHWERNAQDVDNQRSGVTYDGDVVHSIIGKAFTNRATSTADTIVDLNESDVRVGDHLAADQTLTFMISNNPATSPRLMWDNAPEARFLFGNTTELAIGDGAATDQKLTFIDDAGDHTFHYDSDDETYELDGKLKIGGTVSSVTASTGNDMEILVDDGRFVKPDTMIQKSCTVASADSTAVDDCNVLTLTGSTNIDTITACDASNTNRQLLVLCGAYTGDIRDDSVDSGNIKMAGDADLTCTTFDTLLLVCNAPYWLEVSRSVN